MLECAAKACGYEHPHMLFGGRVWNPFANPADTAEMCANLGIDWRNFTTSADCSKGWVTGYAKLEDHDNSRLKAWMYAATMVAATLGGYKNEN